MKKYIGRIGICLISMLIGLVLAVQISTTSGSDQGGLVPLAKLKGYEQALTEVRAEKEEALNQLMVLEKRLGELEDEKAKEDALMKGMVSDMEKYKSASGVQDVEGPGVSITIKDPLATDEYQPIEDSEITYNYELLLSLVNKLKEAGAEAISINEQRIVNATEISLAGNNISINGRATAPPYTIKAIGNPGTLNGALTIRGGVVDEMRNNFDLTVNIKEEENIQIARYSGRINFIYAKPITGE